MKGYDLLTLGFVLIVVGIILVFVGVLASTLQAKDTEVRGGGVILIGPFPIIFGTDTQAVKVVVVLAIILMALAFLFLTRLGR
jgi:uncharacterized protein (TIGR00304 family)